jgi:hypothetical protein
MAFAAATPVVAGWPYPAMARTAGEGNAAVGLSTGSPLLVAAVASATLSGLAGTEDDDGILLSSHITKKKCYYCPDEGLNRMNSHFHERE